MKNLLTEIVTAHGGLERWKSFTKVEATIVSGGALWGMKGLVQDANPRRMSVWLHEEIASVTPYGAADQRTWFTPDRIAIEKLDGKVVAERANPRESFAGHEKLTPWDPLHRAYFNGYALWTYLTTPFVLAMDGVEVSELAPWQEGRETWRVVRAHFPKSIATHSDIQDFYFGEDFLLRRHDYNVDVAGGFVGAQLVFDYIEADGIKLPSKRLAYTRGDDHRPALDPLMVSIDISNVNFT
jgi:hypothetical protein